MCISTVHYCCHRNVMHSVSYRLTQLNGKPCLICSGSFILILKGIVNTVWRREGGGGEGTRGWKNNGAEGGWILPSLLFSTSLPIIPFLSLPLMSVLSISSQCELVAIIYTHCSYIILRTHTAISSIILWPSVCSYHWLVPDEAGGAFKGTGIVGIHYVVAKKSFIWDEKDTDHIRGQLLLSQKKKRTV